jgi:hypothetical protein
MQRKRLKNMESICTVTAAALPTHTFQRRTEQRGYTASRRASGMTIPKKENGKLRKYESPRGDNRHLYFAPCDPGWIEDPATPVIFVEAEKSALAILAWCERHDRPLIPVALGGCWNWRGRIGKTVTPDGERVNEKGPLPDLQIAENRKAYILYDSNVAKNDSVYVARETFITGLQERHADVYVLNLPASPSVNGPDDYLAVHGDAALFTVFETAEHRPAIVEKSSTTLTIHLESYQQIPKEHLQPMWPGYIPFGKLVHLAGDSGEGKSPLTLDLIARVTSGADWPDGTKNALGPRPVILLASEDDPNDTICPRLELAGADLSRVFDAKITKGQDRDEILLALDRDLQQLIAAAAGLPDLALMIIDPITGVNR